MKICIMQPAYLPWLGYFDRVAQCDALVVLDNVQIDKNTKTQFTNRNRIKINNEEKWLTVPVKTKGENKSKEIKDICLDSTSNWRKKHLKSIEQAYRKSKHFDDYFSELSKLILNPEINLSNFLQPFDSFFWSSLNLNTEIFYASKLKLKNKKSELILEICQCLDADKYLSGPFGRNYLNLDLFEKNMITVSFHDYVHPSYLQQGNSFISHLSIVDLLFNVGDSSADILKS